MYETLVQAKLLRLNTTQTQALHTKAIAVRKAELIKLQASATPHEARHYADVLQNFDLALTQGNEQFRLANSIKTLAVQALFAQWHKNNININTLFNQ